MKKHFGNVTGNVSLTTPGMETKEEEAAYEAVRAELSDDKHSEAHKNANRNNCDEYLLCKYHV
jgi:hypothetical protein